MLFILRIHTCGKGGNLNVCFFILAIEPASGELSEDKKDDSLNCMISPCPCDPLFRDCPPDLPYLPSSE